MPHDKFGVFFQEVNLFKLQSPSISYKLRYIVRDEGQYKQLFNKLDWLLKGPGLTILAEEGIQEVMLASIDRLLSDPGVGEYKTKAGGGRDLLAEYISSISFLLRKSTVLSHGKVGFASRSEMDKIVLVKEALQAREPARVHLPKDLSSQAEVSGDIYDKDIEKSSFTPGSRSKYNIVWMMAEWGTGKHAYPDKRRPGDPSDTGTKVPGGGGSWYLGRVKGGGYGGLEIEGQEGAHFLFGERASTESVRKDIDRALTAIRNRIALELDSFK